ncbi:uncharacterized protein involved in response to NO [Rhizobium sp. BK196]|uniref:NnrS family protein n=1 Tax=Rhizobium sp. BK196 TaxID=2587073 RepID=UPI001619C7CF|nr:NnrS family protein [Rhizobium sp. BK196]MBB3312321.1 uncharacterized protein involved in response to NO [Rhizobium sp. BK196]
MKNTSDAARDLPRGMSRTGPVLFSYGFRPFFLASALFAIASIDIWVAHLSFGVPVAPDYGTLYWHAHEMLFGFAPAVLAGFLLTAIPNWTGRLPIADRPLAMLFAIWCAGRIAMLLSGSIGIVLATAIDSLFLPVMLLVCAREVVAGKKWKDLKVIAGLFVLSLANVLFHIAVIEGIGPELAIRLGIGAYVLLVTIVGGRILPSFTRNWINQSGRTDFPVPYNSFDAATIIIGAVVLVLWACAPDATATCGTAAVAAVLNTIRLIRWRGWTTWPESILFVLHATFLFVPIGFAAISLQASGLLPEVAVLHIFAIGTISMMMLAVMTRATRGHTGRRLKSSRMTNISYVLLGCVALVRPLAELIPTLSTEILALAGIGWTAAFGLFVVEHGPLLWSGRKPLTMRGG